MRYVVVSNFPENFLEEELLALKTYQEGVDALLDVVERASSNNEALHEASIPIEPPIEMPIHLLSQDNDEKPLMEYFVGNQVFGLYQRPTKRLPSYIKKRL